MTLSITLTILLLASALIGAPLGEPETVIDLSGPQILAGELAVAVPAFAAVDPDTPLGPAPRPGVERRLSYGVLRRWAARLGLRLDAEQPPRSLLLRRRLRRLGAAEAQAVLEQAAAESLGLPADSVSVELLDPAEPLVPDAKLELALGSRIAALNRPVRLRLTWREPGGVSGQQVFNATVRARGRYLVARRELPARTLLNPGDFELVEDWLPAHASSSYLTDSSQFEDKSLRRSMKRGEALNEALVIDSPTIQRGALVELRLSSGPIRLRTPARAEDSGCRGELIAFRNLSTGQRVLAVIVDAKAAEVQTP